MRMLRWIIINKRKDGVQNGEFFKGKGSSYWWKIEESLDIVWSCAKENYAPIRKSDLIQVHRMKIGARRPKITQFSALNEVKNASV